MNCLVKNQEVARGGRSPLGQPEISRGDVSLCLCVECQAAAVGVLLRFFRFGVLAFEIGQHYVQRLVTKADADDIDRRSVEWE